MNKSWSEGVDNIFEKARRKAKVVDGAALLVQICIKIPLSYCRYPLA